MIFITKMLYCWWKTCATACSVENVNFKVQVTVFTEPYQLFQQNLQDMLCDWILSMYVVWKCGPNPCYHCWNTECFVGDGFYWQMLYIFCTTQNKYKGLNHKNVQLLLNYFPCQLWVMLAFYNKTNKLTKVTRYGSYSSRTIIIKCNWQW